LAAQVALLDSSERLQEGTSSAIGSLAGASLRNSDVRRRPFSKTTCAGVSRACGGGRSVCEETALFPFVDHRLTNPKALKL